MSTRGFGGLRDVGYYGYSWSSAIAGSNARYLDFYYDGVTPQNNNYRAYGLQLRCLQEQCRSAHESWGFLSQNFLARMANKTPNGCGCSAQ